MIHAKSSVEWGSSIAIHCQGWLVTMVFPSIDQGKGRDIHDHS